MPTIPASLDHFVSAWAHLTFANRRNGGGSLFEGMSELADPRGMRMNMSGKLTGGTSDSPVRIISRFNDQPGREVTYSVTMRQRSGVNANIEEAITNMRTPRQGKHQIEVPVYNLDSVNLGTIGDHQMTGFDNETVALENAELNMKDHVDESCFVTLWGGSGNYGNLWCYGDQTYDSDGSPNFRGMEAIWMKQGYKIPAADGSETYTAKGHNALTRPTRMILPDGVSNLNSLGSGNTLTADLIQTANSRFRVQSEKQGFFELHPHKNGMPKSKVQGVAGDTGMGQNNEGNHLIIMHEESLRALKNSNGAHGYIQFIHDATHAVGWKSTFFTGQMTMVDGAYILTHECVPLFEGDSSNTNVPSVKYGYAMYLCANALTIATANYWQKLDGKKMELLNRQQTSLGGIRTMEGHMEGASDVLAWAETYNHGLSARLNIQRNIGFAVTRATHPYAPGSKSEELQDVGRGCVAFAQAWERPAV